MRISDTKYLIAYIPPACTVAAIYVGGVLSYLTVIVAFIIIPCIDLMLPPNPENEAEEQYSLREKEYFFTLLLYGNLVWVAGMLWFFCHRLMNTPTETYEWVGLILSTGIALGSNGINVAHELGHKSGGLPQTAASLLLLPSMYMHFTIEHNFGHHARVGTPEDPATSRMNENVFAFFFRSITGGWKSAWRFESSRLRQTSKLYGILHNRILGYTLLQTAYIGILYLICGMAVALSMLAVALLSVLLLEAINYIEHYGLLRQKNHIGRYETVESFHSWNSDHQAGRIILYELTRHSDHHYKAFKQYQTLQHHDESPQLPYGYPASILLALVPPLWFSVMNPRVELWRTRFAAA